MLEGTIVQGRQVIFRFVIVTLDLHARVCVVQDEADEVENKARYDYFPLVLAPYTSEVTFGLFHFVKHGTNNMVLVWYNYFTYKSIIERNS